MLALDHASRPAIGPARAPSFSGSWRPATLAFSVALLLASSASDGWTQAVQLVAVDVTAVAQGLQASKLIGSRVNNDKDERIGTFEDLVITRDRGLFAVLQVGGFLGLGGRLVAVSYDTLNIGDDGRKITLAGASKEALEKLPEFQFKK